MGENSSTNTTENKTMFTIKNILRVLLLLCIVFVFCPSFLVSCSGQDMNGSRLDMNVSVMTAVGGVEVYGEKVVASHPIMLLCLLIPVAALVLLFIKKFTDNKNALIIMLCAIADFVIWLIFRSSVKKAAEENYCSFKSTGWYIINIIALILIILISAFVVLTKQQMDADLITAFSGGGSKEALDKMSTAMSQMSSAVIQLAGNASTNIANKLKKEDAIGYCSKCGSPIPYGCKCCTSCGTAVPESMLAETEAARKAAEEAAREAEKQAAEATQTPDNTGKPMYCQQCGAKLRTDAIFCDSCGKKIE